MHGASGEDKNTVQAHGASPLFDAFQYFFAITLTLRHKPHIKRQNPGDQVNRDRRKSVEIKSAATGEGVSAEELL